MRKTQIWNDNYIELQFGSKTILFLGNLAQVPGVTRSKANFDVVRQQFFNSPWNKNFQIKVKRVFEIWLKDYKKFPILHFDEYIFSQTWI